MQLHNGLDNLRFSFWQMKVFLQYPDWLWGPASYGMKLTTHLHLVLRCSLTFSRCGSILNTENFYIKKSFQLAYKAAKTTHHHLKHNLLTYRFIVIKTDRGKAGNVIVLTFSRSVHISLNLYHLETLTLCVWFLFLKSKINIY